jgi:hypothetical protein
MSPTSEQFEGGKQSPGPLPGSERHTPEPVALAPSHVARSVLGLSVAAYGAVAIWLVWRTSVLEPFADMFDWLERWGRLQRDGDLVRYLWAPHNFHHMVITLGVLAADIGLFDGQGYLFLGVGVACLAATAAILARLAARAAGPGLRLVGAGGALALSLMGCDVLDATTAIDTTYVHALVFAVAAIWLAAGDGGATRRGGALACAVASGLGSAVGLAVWPALAFAAWRGGRRGWMLAILATGAVWSGVYLLGEFGTRGLGALHQERPSLATSVPLFINYLALPWMRADPALGGPLGLAILVVALAALFMSVRSPAPQARAAEALIVFSLGTAAMAGLARTADMTPALMPMRYAVLLIPLHVGLWILALPLVRRVWTEHPRIGDATAVVAAVSLLAHQAVMSVYAVRTNDIVLEALTDFRAGGASAMPALFGPDLARARAIAADLKRQGLYQSELRAAPSSVRRAVAALPDPSAVSGPPVR